MGLLSVNVGRPRPNPWKGLGATGIDKRPVAGPVAVTAPGPKGTGEVGLAGDLVEIVHRPGHDVTVALTFRALTLEPGLLPRLLAADALPEGSTDLARRRVPPTTPDRPEEKIRHR